MLTKEQLKLLKNQMEKVELPEWAEALGVSPEESFVYVKGLDGFSLKFVAELQDKGQDHKIYLLVLCLCDEQKNTLFDLEDMDWLLKLPMSGLIKIIDAACRVNHLGAYEHEALLKN